MHSVSESAYAAGLFDGEGYVGVNGGSHTRAHQLCVIIAMSDPQPVTPQTSSKETPV